MPVRYGNGPVRKSLQTSKPINRLKAELQRVTEERAWVTDITYIRTAEGWLFLAVVIDLFSRQVVDWSMQPRMRTFAARYNTLIHHLRQLMKTPYR